MNIKRYISIVLALVMLCTPVISGPQVYAGEVDEYFVEADAVISRFVGNLFTGENVTREQFAVALAKTMKIEGINPIDPFFSDVTDKSIYSKEIYALANAGIISKSTEFNPSENITLSQAVKMCVCALGCAVQAESDGGYPAGYLRLAKSMKLTGNISSANELSKSSATKLLYNLLCSTIMPVGYVNDIVHIKSTGETYLEKLYHVACKDGIVTATNICPENGGAPEKDGYIVVGGVSYAYDGATDKLLGKNVRVFVDDEKKEAILVLERRNTVIEERFLDVTEFSLTEISIEKDSKRDKAYKTNGARHIYNGRSVDNFSDIAITGDFATIMLLDNNEDNNFEYVFIYDYKYLIADKVLDNPATITDTNKNPAFKVQSDEVVLFVQDENGLAMELDDINKGDVLAIAEDRSKEVVFVKRVSNKAEGVLSKKTSDGKVYINDQKYTLTDYAERNYKNITKIGESYSFLLGLDNDIVALNNFSSKMQYGLLIAAKKGDGLFTEEAQMKVFSMDSNIKILNIIRNVRIDGFKKETAEAVVDVLDDHFSELIKYRLNAEGKVCVIDTANTVYEYDEPDDEENSLLQYKFKAQDGNGAFTDDDLTEFEYRSGGQSCIPYFNVDTSLIFVTPSDASKNEGYYITDKSSLISGTKYEFNVYDMSESGTPKFLVVEESNVKSRTNYMIEEVSTGLMPNGDVGTILHVYSAGAFTELYMEDTVKETLANELKSGDIIQATTDDLRNVKFIDVAFSEEIPEAPGQAAIPQIPVLGEKLVANQAVNDIRYEGLSNISYWYGSLYSTDGTYAYISRKKKDDDNGKYDYSFKYLKNIRINVSTIGLINKERTEIRPITPAELQDYKSVGDNNYFLVVRLNAQAPMEVYAYEAR